MKLLKLLFISFLIAGSLIGTYLFGYKSGGDDVIPVAAEAGYTRGTIDAFRQMNVICSSTSRVNFKLPEGTTQDYVCMPIDAQPQQQSPRTSRNTHRELQVSL